MRIVEMARNDIKNSSLLKTKFLIYAFNGRTLFFGFKVKKSGVKDDFYYTDWKKKVLLDD